MFINSTSLNIVLNLFSKRVVLVFFWKANLFQILTFENLVFPHKAKSCLFLIVKPNKLMSSLGPVLYLVQS